VTRTGVLQIARTLGAAVAASATLAHAQTPADALGWLRKIYEATQDLSYSGTFVYQEGDQSETSRIVHVAGRGTALEKLEALDGARREIVRTRDTVRCYLPDIHTVKVDRHGVEPREHGRGFPAMLPERLSSLAHNYTITLNGTARVAGYECREVVLRPNDQYRYGYRLWADQRTGMLLKARTFNEHGKTLEQFTFTQLKIGHVRRSEARLRRIPPGWHVEDSTVEPVDLAASGWSVSPDLPGFEKVAEVKRKLRDTQMVDQVVYSDGMAAVSVFIEPLPAGTAGTRPGLSSTGATNLYTREVADHLVTVIGEAPAISVQRIGDSVEYHPRH
jgi:sigma-E factor negative regulatory protein RseB